MKATIVYIDVKPECIEKFSEACVYNHDNSRKEPENIRFDVLQSKDDPTKFMLYEVFEDDAAITFHKTTEHYKKWAEVAEESMAAPRSKTSVNALAFN